MSNAQPVIALKVDVNTREGTCDGVPRLLELFDGLGIKATFYFAMGPDTTGQAVRRIFRRGFLRKILRTRRYLAYRPATLLYGTVIPPPLIAAAFPDILRDAERRGHETGIHCWDHQKWQDYLPWLPKPVTAMEMGKASAEYEEIIGRRGRTTAAPGWMVSADSLEIQDAMGLDFCSDTRGIAPFYPVVGGRRFRTLQVPTTWPTLDEIIGRNGTDPESATEYYLQNVLPGLNVHTMQAELEGRLLAPHCADLLARLRDRGTRFITLGTAAREFGPGAPACSIVMGEIPGREGKVALQGKVST